MFGKELKFRGKKLTGRDLSLAAVALFALVFWLVFYNLGSSAESDKNKIETDVSLAKTAYTQSVSNSDVDAATEDKAEIESQVNTVFPGNDKGEGLIILLSDWAEDSGLQITDETVSTSESDKIAEADCLATTVTIKVKGAATKLTDFLKCIRDSDVNTLVVDAVDSDYASPDWVATIKVTAYTGASYKAEEDE